MRHTNTERVGEKENININFSTFSVDGVWFNVHLVRFHNLMLGFTIIDWNKTNERASEKKNRRNIVYSLVVTKMNETARKNELQK